MVIFAGKQYSFHKRNEAMCTIFSSDCYFATSKVITFKFALNFAFKLCDRLEWTNEECDQGKKVV